MTLFIIIFGTLTCLAGIAILVNQEIVFGFLRKNSDRYLKIVEWSEEDQFYVGTCPWMRGCGTLFNNLIDFLSNRY